MIFLSFFVCVPLAHLMKRALGSDRIAVIFSREYFPFQDIERLAKMPLVYIALSFSLAFVLNLYIFRQANLNDGFLKKSMELVFIPVIIHFIILSVIKAKRKNDAPQADQALTLFAHSLADRAGIGRADVAVVDGEDYHDPYHFKYADRWSVVIPRKHFDEMSDVSLRWTIARLMHPASRANNDLWDYLAIFSMTTASFILLDIALIFRIAPFMILMIIAGMIDISLKNLVRRELDLFCLQAVGSLELAEEEIRKEEWEKIGANAKVEKRVRFLREYACLQGIAV